MPARTAAEKLARKQALEEKREARRLAKEKKEKTQNATQGNKAKATPQSTKEESREPKGKYLLFQLSDHTLATVLCFLPSRDVGALTLSCRHFSELLVEARVNYLMSRLKMSNHKMSGTVGCLSMCSDQNEAR